MAECKSAAAGAALALSGCLGCASAAAQTAPAIDFYGSLRTQAEHVSPDRRARLGAYAGVRDAYSRVGVSAEYPLGAGLALSGQLELPVDSANLRMRDPYDQGDPSRPHGERVRIARIGVRGGFGALTYGQQWMPFLQTYVKLFTASFTVEFLLRRSWFHPAILQGQSRLLHRLTRWNSPPYDKTTQV